MKYKIAKPEDNTDVEGYQFKLTHAYSKCVTDMITLLARIDGILSVVDDESTTKVEVKEWLTDLAKEYSNETP